MAYLNIFKILHFQPICLLLDSKLIPPPGMSVGIIDQSAYLQFSRLLLKCDGTRAETRFRLLAKRTSPFKSVEGVSVQSITGSRGVRISGSNAG